MPTWHVAGHLYFFLPVWVIVEKTGVFPVLRTHGQSQRNSTMTPKLQKFVKLISTSTGNENSNLALRSITAVAISG
jgi:hypothetical protein